MLGILLLPLLRLTHLLLIFKFANLKRLNFMDSEGTQYAVFPDKSLDYADAKKTCRFNDAHLPQFPSIETIVFFEKAYKQMYAPEIRKIKFWISAIKLKEHYNLCDSTHWKSDDGSGEILTHFPNQTSIGWDDRDDDALEPKDCLTFVFNFRIFASDHCSNRNNVLCMRRLSNFLIKAGIPFADKSGNQYVIFKDPPANYSEAKARCLGHHATLISFQSDFTYGLFRDSLANTKNKYRNKSLNDLKFWLSATRTAERYTTGDNIWKVDNRLGTTVFPRLKNVLWLDSQSTHGNVSADCLQFDFDSNIFQAVDCGVQRSMVCKKAPLELAPYVSASSPRSIETIDTNVPETMRQRLNETSAIDGCGGISDVTIILSCILAVTLVISVTISIIFILKIRMLKSACLCDKKTNKKILFSSTISKGTKSPTSEASDKAIATDGEIFCKNPGENNRIIKGKARKTNAMYKMPKFIFNAKTTPHQEKPRKPACSDTVSTDYEFIGKPAEQNKKARKH